MKKKRQMKHANREKEEEVSKAKFEEGRRLKKFFTTYHLLKRHYQGKNSKEQAKAIRSLDLLSDKKLWYATKEEILPKEQIEAMHSEVYHRIASEKEFPKQNWHEAKQSLTVRRTFPTQGIRPLLQKKNLNIPTPWRAVAVFALITLGAALLQTPQILQKTQTFVADTSYTSQQLPDGTTVILNKGSFLTLANDFNAKERRLKMTGEVFFDVSKNPQKPFIIEHGTLTTVVKGTSFTISDFPQIDKNSLIVHSGKVSIRRGKKEVALLTPNQKLVYDSSLQEIIITNTDAKQVAEWTKGMLTFTDANEKELRLRMQQHFSIDLIIKDNAFSKTNRMQFNAQFGQNAKAEDIMEHLKLVYGIAYEREENTITIYRN